MQVQFFTIPALAYEEGQEALNKFLRGRRVLEVRQEFMASGDGAYWCIAVKYIERNKSEVRSKGQGDLERVDYKKILDEPAFKVFDLLRHCRKEIAEKHAIPVYAVFTNAELANMAVLQEITVEKLKTIHGIGSRKLEKFGHEIITLYQENYTNEEGGKPDPKNS